MEEQGSAKGPLELSGESVPESCRSSRPGEAEGGASMEVRPRNSASITALLEGNGPEAIESALWLHYKAVAPYLLEEPVIGRQDSASRVSVGGAKEPIDSTPQDKAA